ncbi:hypothetical protein GCM10022247_45980 [Allokutzneria multivorans]|uniref:Uncharacterized protein n=1 Tax=Allokutzneria multivorans TaxID=1142134 RepID=A0ABP7SWI7_9PSEU
MEMQYSLLCKGSETVNDNPDAATSVRQHVEQAHRNMTLAHSSLNAAVKLAAAHASAMPWGVGVELWDLRNTLAEDRSPGSRLKVLLDRMPPATGDLR